MSNNRMPQRFQQDDGPMQSRIGIPGGSEGNNLDECVQRYHPVHQNLRDQHVSCMRNTLQNAQDHQDLAQGYQQCNSQHASRLRTADQSLSDCIDQAQNGNGNGNGNGYRGQRSFSARQGSGAVSYYR